MSYPFQGTTTGGYLCTECYQFVAYGQQHKCVDGQKTLQPTIGYYEQQEQLLPTLERIAKALEKLVEKETKT